jgi:membrane protease YdiL (CAAX protease family)
MASSYWSATRAPRYSLTFVLPLLLLYEGLARLLSGTAGSGIRNGADVLLKSLFFLLGGQLGLTIFASVLIGTGAVLVWRDRQRNGPIAWSYFLGMTAESVLYALLFGLVTSTVTALLLHGPSALALGQSPRFDLPTQVMVSLGAGIYEELLFRVIVVGALAKLASVVFGWRPALAGAFATLVGALIFSIFHYIGPLGDRLELTSFAFRTVAGVLLSGLFLLRGFGIAAWTHALYDVFLAIGGM